MKINECDLVSRRTGLGPKAGGRPPEYFAKKEAGLRQRIDRLRDPINEPQPGQALLVARRDEALAKLHRLLAEQGGASPGADGAARQRERQEQFTNLVDATREASTRMFDGPSVELYAVGATLARSELAVRRGLRNIRTADDVERLALSMEQARIANADPEQAIKVSSEKDLSQMSRGRSLSDYFQYHFPTRLRDDLFGLRPDQVWLEVGTGVGWAVLEFIEKGGAARVVGTDLAGSPTITKLERSHPAQFTFHLGNVRQAPIAKGTVSVITDVYTAMSYDTQLSAVLQQYGELLEVGGRAYLSYSKSRTAVVRTEGTLDLADWLATIRGLKVDDLGSSALSDRLMITKLSDEVVVPPLTLGGIGTENTPPIRAYYEPGLKVPKGTRRRRR